MKDNVVTPCPEIELLLPAYALDALEPAETTVVAVHVMYCPPCQRLLAEYRQVTAALPSLLYTAAPQQPPARLKQKLLANIETSPPAAHSYHLPEAVAMPPAPLPARRPPLFSPSHGPQPAPPAKPDRGRWLPHTVLFISLLLLAATLSLALGNPLRPEVGPLAASTAASAQNERRQIFLTLGNSGHDESHQYLYPTADAPAPDAYAQLSTKPIAAIVVVQAHNLPQPPPQHGYFVWYGPAGKALFGGILSVDEAGQGYLEIKNRLNLPVAGEAFISLQPLSDLRADGTAERPPDTTNP